MTVRRVMVGCACIVAFMTPRMERGCRAGGYLRGTPDRRNVAIRAHLHEFGPDSVLPDSPAIEAFIAEAEVAL